MPGQRESDSPSVRAVRRTRAPSLNGALILCVLVHRDLASTGPVAALEGRARSRVSVTLVAIRRYSSQARGNAENRGEPRHLISRINPGTYK